MTHAQKTIKALADQGIKVEIIEETTWRCEARDAYGTLFSVGRSHTSAEESVDYLYSKLLASSRLDTKK